MSSFINLPEDIIIEILSYFSLYRIIRLETVCKYIQTLIRNTKWNHTFRVNKEKKVEHVCRTYQFSKLVVSDEICILSEKSMDKFRKYSSLSMKFDSVKSLRSISDCKHLDLTVKKYPENVYLNCLTNLQSLKLSDGDSLGGTVKNSDGTHSLVYENLANLTSLTLEREGYYFTYMIPLLTNLKELILPENVRSKSKTLLTNLTNLEKLKMYFQTGDPNISYLTNLHSLSLHYDYFYNEINGIFFLTNLTSLKLSTINAQFHVKTLTNILSNLRSLKLSEYSLTDSDFDYFTNLETLSIENKCAYSEINIDCLTKLRSLKVNGYILNDSSFKKLTNLTYLNIVDCPKITNPKLINLIHLRKLVINLTLILDDYLLQIMKRLDVLCIKTKTDRSTFKISDTFFSILKEAGVSVIYRR